MSPRTLHSQVHSSGDDFSEEVKHPSPKRLHYYLDPKLDTMTLKH
jgi:hypothetical protein